jgi:hypothetical protein
MVVVTSSLFSFATRGICRSRFPTLARRNIFKMSQNSEIIFKWLTSKSDAAENPTVAYVTPATSSCAFAEVSKLTIVYLHYY